MFAPLKHQVYRRLFTAQILSLTGTGILTVALGLLAFQLAGDDAGVVLGTALFIKMIAYVTMAPLASAFAGYWPRKRFLIALDLVRAAIVLALPFIDQIWQIYVLIFMLQTASAAFTPGFQALIPDILPDEQEYTKALSLARLAYDMETLISPVLAAALLFLISFHWLFAGTALGFLASAYLVKSVLLPAATPDTRTDGFYQRLTRGMRIYFETPRLKGLLALNFAAAAGSAMVIVNTVPLTRSTLNKGEVDVAFALMAFGAGSMLAALLLPKMLDQVSDRKVMIGGAGILTAALTGFAATILTIGLFWGLLLSAWFLIGLGYAGVMTPIGRLIRRSAHAPDLPSLFAAQFALSHLCWLVTYPMAGFLGARLGMAETTLILAGLSAGGIFLALKLWPKNNTVDIAHSHPELPADHMHLTGTNPHTHPIIIDEIHPHWPKNA